MTKKLLVVSVLLVVVAFANADLLQNGGFENGTGTTADDWGNTGLALSQRSSDMAKSGTYSLKLLPDSTYTGSSSRWVSVTQEIDGTGVVEGETVTFTINGYNPSSNPLAGNVRVDMKITLFDSSNTLLAQGKVTAMSNNSPQDQWINSVASVEAPAGVDHVVTELQIVYKYAGLGGAVYFDDFSTSLVPEPTTMGVLTTGAVCGLIKRRRNQ